MLVFLAILQFIVTIIVLYAFWIPLLSRMTGQKISLHPIVSLLLFASTFYSSLSLYFEWVSLFSLSSKPYSVNVSADNILAILDFCIQHSDNAVINFTVTIIVVAIILYIVYSKVAFFKQSNGNKFLFAIVCLYLYTLIPYIGIAGYVNQVRTEVRTQQAKQEESKEAFVTTNLQPIYNKLYNTGKGNTFISLPTKQGCNDKSYELGTISSCGEAALLCRNISMVKDTKDIAHNCRENGW